MNGEKLSKQQHDYGATTKGPSKWLNGDKTMNK